MNAPREAASLPKILLALVAALLATTLGLAGLLAWMLARPVALGDLARGDRARLVAQAQRVVPDVYEDYPFAGDPGFYRMRPGEQFDGVHGISFRTNELGFRSRAISRKPAGVRRILLVGDSWTFGPYVEQEQTFPRRIERHLAESPGGGWEVHAFGMMGWTFENAIAALQVLRPLVDPEIVVFCLTSNDIDDPFRVWQGRLVGVGFDSGSIFRNAYEWERRWVGVFERVQGEARRMEEQGVRTLAFLVADWPAGVAPHYAELAGFETPYVALPTVYLEGEYRLPGTIDPGEHATVEGHRVIAAYLINALRELGWIDAAELPLDRAVTFPRRDRDPAALVEAFRAAGRIARDQGSLRTPGDAHGVGRNAIFSVPRTPGARNLRVRFDLIDEVSLYPLHVRFEIAAPRASVVERTFESHVAGTQEVELEVPDSLDRYEFLEIFVRADRESTSSPGQPPASLRPRSFEAF